MLHLLGTVGGAGGIGVSTGLGGESGLVPEQRKKRTLDRLKKQIPLR